MSRSLRSRLLELLIVVGSVLATSSSCAQSFFNRTFHYEDYMGSLEPVSGPSGFLICSTIRYDLGYIDGFQFTRFDSTGNVLHTRAFSAGSLVNVMQWAALSRVRSNGNFAFLFGSSPYNGGYRPSFRVFSATSSGSIIWNRQISYAHPDSSFDFIGAMDQAFEETPDGGTLITGLRRSPSSGAPVVVKLDSSGNILWNKTYDLHLPWGWHIVSDVDEAGDLLLGFHADSTAVVASNNCILARISAGGNTLWSKRIDGLQGMLTGCAKVDGRYVVSASDSSSIYLLNLDTAGVPLWGKRYVLTLPLWTWGLGIVPTHDHGFVLTADVPDNAGNSDVFFFKVDSMGAAQWERTYGNENYEGLVDLVENEDSTFTMLTGTQLTQNWSVHSYLSRLDPMGMNDCITPVSDLVTEMPFTFSLVDVVLDEFESLMTSVPLYLGDSTAYDPEMVDTCLYSDVVRVEDRIQSHELLIYPNPTSGMTTVRIPDQKRGANFIVLDLFGKQIKNAILSKTETLVDLSEQSCGVYLYRLVMPDGKTLFGKLIKE